MLVFPANVNSAFIGTGLSAYLNSIDVNCLVIVGLTTDHCVSATTRNASDLGLKVILVSDATATFDHAGPDGEVHKAEDIHAVHIASLHREFCDVGTTASLLGS